MSDDERALNDESALPDPNPYASPQSVERDADPVSVGKSAGTPAFARWHLLLWLGCSAVAFFNDHWLWNLPIIWGWSLPTIRTAIMVVSSAVHGVPMAVSIVCIERRWRGGNFPAQPGEYWLAASGIGLWLKIVGFGLLGIFYLPVMVEPWFVTIHGFVVTSLFVYSAIQVRAWRYWSVCLGAIATVMFGIFLRQAMILVQLVATGQPPLFGGAPFGMLSLAAMCVTVISLGLATDADRRQSLRRGWIHRLAIWWIFAFVLITVLRVLV